MVEGIHGIRVAGLSDLADKLSGMVFVVPFLVTSHQDVCQRPILLHIDRHVVGTVAQDAFVGVDVSRNISKLHLFSHLNLRCLDSMFRG